MNQFKVKISHAVLTEPLINTPYIDEILVKASVEAESSAFSCRYLAGTIVEKGISARKFEQGQPVLACLPLECTLGIKELYKKTILVDEKYLIPLKPDTDLKKAAALSAVAVKAYTALFERGKFVKDETVMIIGGANNTGLLISQLVAKIGGKVLLFANSIEELNFLNKVENSINAKIYLLNNEELTDTVREETLGLGVDVLIDLRESHTTEEKRKTLECLSVNGRWIVSDNSIEIHAPETKQLFYRNATISFLFEEAYSIFGIDFGKTLAMIEDAVERLNEKKFTIEIREEIEEVAELEALVKGEELSLLGKLGATLANLS